MKTISILNHNDLTEAFALEQLCHTIPWSKTTFFSNQGDRYLNLKLTIDNKIIGFCICQLVADEANLFNIAIHPEFRQKGLAKELLNKLIEELLSLNSNKPIASLWLEVRKSNDAAIRLYHSLGFNQITIRRNYYPTVDGKQEDAIIMAYTLTL
ncbi:ribosomal protein S18-alanine N-acetyltransferase [Gilliamella sp. B14384G15]|uniref:ribosomal protein S18-alanine N-acetyltransferase n=1 Tax=unclassified Gilliamella TaxID=2685620 RepID=UPI0018DD4AE0|nr:MULTISPECIES: ribosomal protein S18-alanine N-acetyltransferase [unclassified Gilliamella]MBI0030744.1 ribosomal protein S18-alanine N-acetyltransferase [Gilliamella sp. B14384G15]MBI0058085.1 ribosomal protein S18-alanine N-acetyltransferase [Gilliamella sp. B14384G12]